MQIAVNDLFYNQIDTIAQITALAIPVFILISSSFDVYHPSALKLNRLLVPYLFGALMIIFCNASTLLEPNGLCEFYKSCGQPEAVNPCFNMVNLCHHQLKEAHWKGRSNDTIEKMTYKLCNRILEPGKTFARLQKCTTCLLPEPKDLEKIIQLQKDLVRLTHCDPGIRNNPYYRIFKPLGIGIHEHYVKLCVVATGGFILTNIVKKRIHAHH